MCAGQISPHFCTVEKLGPTEGPNILTIFILNENMVGHNEVTIIPMVLTFRCTPKKCTYKGTYTYKYISTYIHKFGIPIPNRIFQI